MRYTRSAAATLLLAALGCGEDVLPPPTGLAEPAASPVAVAPPVVPPSTSVAPPSPSGEESADVSATASEPAAASSSPSPPLPPSPWQPEATDPAGIRLVTGFDCSPRNLAVSCRGPGHFEVRFPRGGRDTVGYFLFRVENAAGKEVRVDLTHVPIGKWWSVNPVVCDDPDPAKLDNFVSRPVETPKPPEKAPNGPQLPDDSGERWRFVKDVTADKAVGTLTLRHVMPSDGCLVAMRPPYTPAYHENYLASLAGDDRVTVHRVGASGEGRPLSVIQVGGQDEQSRRENPCLLVYAREHPDEHDGSWVAQGAVGYLLLDENKAAKALRKKLTLLVIPVFDPDGAVKSKYDHVTDRFNRSELPDTPESEAYARFLKSWVDDLKGRLDFVISLHNVESSESGHFACGSLPRWEKAAAFAELTHARIVSEMRASGVDVPDKPWGPDNYLFRLAGWASLTYGPAWLLYEANSQAPKRHLTLGETRLLGAMLVDAAGRHLTSEAARPLLANVDRHRRWRGRQWLLWQPDFRVAPSGTVIEFEDLVMRNAEPEELRGSQEYQAFLKALEDHPEYR